MRGKWGGFRCMRAALTTFPKTDETSAVMTPCTGEPLIPRKEETCAVARGIPGDEVLKGYVVEFLLCI